MKLDEIAARITAHLRRIEADPVLNPNIDYDPVVGAWVAVAGNKGMRRFYGSWAARAGRYVRVRYVSYQGNSNLTRDEALAYLAWLDAGNVGTHHSAKAGGA